MKKSKIILVTFTLVWIFVAIAIGSGLRNFPFSVIIRSDQRETELFCNVVDGNYCIFLPSYTDNAEVVICADEIFGVTIDGVRLYDEMDVRQFPLNTPMELTYYNYDGIRSIQITFVQSANVGTLYLDVPERDMEYVHEKKGNKASGTACMYDANGQVLYNGTLSEISGRGNYTWFLDKKPYGITLSKDADLLGTGAADRWILLANAFDTSNLRNKIAYTFASDFGLAYSPACDWVDLYINGCYHGLYLLSERNEIHPQRINIDENESFLLSAEPEYRMIEQNYPYHCTANGNIFRIRSNSMAEGEMEYVIQCAENAILAEDGIDPWTQKYYTELIDMDSWARKYLIEEIFGNYDGGRISQFYYYTRSDGKIYAGPIWDMDNTMGISSLTAAPNMLLAGRHHMLTYEDQPLFYALMQKEDFRQTVLTLYQEEMLPLLETYCQTVIPAYSQRICQARQNDQLFWGWSSTDLRSNSAEFICDYLGDRTAFWTDYWFSDTPYYTVEFNHPVGLLLALLVKEGENLSTFPCADQNCCLAGTEEFYDISLPIYQDLVLECSIPNSETE